MSPKLKRILLPVVILLVAILLLLLLKFTKPAAEPVTISEKAWPVKAQIANPAAWRPQLELFGPVEAVWESRLNAGVEADVLRVHAVEGQAVAEGDLLIELDDSDARLLLEQRQAEQRQVVARIASQEASYEASKAALPREIELLKLKKAELARATDLVRKKVGSQSTLDTASQAVQSQSIVVSNRRQTLLQQKAKLDELAADLERADARLQQAELALQRTRVHAPFTGRITRVSVAPGTRVRVGNELLRLYDRTALQVRAQIAERFLPRVRAALASGAVVTVSGRADDQTFPARLDRLAGKVDAGGNMAGLFRLEPGLELRPGRFVALHMQLPPESGVIAVPAEALYGPERIYRIDDEQRLRAVRVIRVGEARDAEGLPRILIRAPGLPAGSRLCVTQLANAVDGLLVNVVDSADGD